MNYIHGEDRNQMRIESLESFASPDSEVRVIDKIVDAMDIESLGFKLGNNKDSGRPKFDPKDLLKLYTLSKSSVFWSTSKRFSTP